MNFTKGSSSHTGRRLRPPSRSVVAAHSSKNVNKPFFSARIVDHVQSFQLSTGERNGA